MTFESPITPASPAIAGRAGAARICPHERRPGTSVCLHCRHVELAILRARRNRVVGNVFAGSIVVAAIVGVVVSVLPLLSARLAAVTAARPAAESSAQVAPAVAAASGPAPVATPSTTALVAAAASPESAIAASMAALLVSVAPAPVLTPSIVDSSAALMLGALTPPESAVRAVAAVPGDQAAASAAAPPSVVAGAAAPPPAPAPTASAAKPSLALTLIIPEGTTVLPDSVILERTGDNLRVHFDTSDLRTRRAEKLEQIIRATLPAAYGPLADSLLTSLPAGGIASAGDILTDLSVHGIRLTARGSSLSLYPETRPGRDGPIVVAYRVIPSP